MKQIPVEEAVGSILCHDITQILPGEFKGRKFKKGHIIKEEDIPVLLSLGKEHIFVWENQPANGAVNLADIMRGNHLGPEIFSRRFHRRKHAAGGGGGGTGCGGHDCLGTASALSDGGGGPDRRVARGWG